MFSFSLHEWTRLSDETFPSSSVLCFFPLALFFFHIFNTIFPLLLGLSPFIFNFHLQDLHSCILLAILVTCPLPFSFIFFESFHCSSNMPTVLFTRYCAGTKIFDIKKKKIETIFLLNLQLEKKHGHEENT